MISILNKSTNTFPKLKTPLIQKCNICKAELKIDDLWDIDVHELTYADCCGEPWLKVNLSVNCPNCHYDTSINILNSQKYLNTLKQCNIQPKWIEKYKFLTPLEKSVEDTIKSLKTCKDKSFRDSTLYILAENLFTLARLVRTFNFPYVTLSNGEYDPDFERFCNRYEDGIITNVKEAKAFLIKEYGLEKLIK